MQELFSLQGKVALVTGAGRGIGEAIARGMLKAGAKVASFEKVLPSDGESRDVRFYSVDLADRQALKIAFDRFVAELGRIDILVNCAGITRGTTSEDYSEQDWDLTLAVNLTAVFALCQHAGRQMIQQGQGGSIINLTSIGSNQGFPGNPGYCATKGAVRNLTRALAYDWGKHQIRVNNLAPGYTHTPMNTKSWNDPELRAQRASHTFLGRWAEPEDMVGAAVFLASQASVYMTGQDLFIDGGWSAKGI